jgi:hypothetical protein
MTLSNPCSCKNFRQSPSAITERKTLAVQTKTSFIYSPHFAEVIDRSVAMLRKHYWEVVDRETAESIGASVPKIYSPS